MLEKSNTSIILCYSKEVKVNFSIKVKVVRVSNLIQCYISKHEHVWSTNVWSTKFVQFNCKLPISN